jgi:hypothetical protein
MAQGLRAFVLSCLHTRTLTRPRRHPRRR